MNATATRRPEPDQACVAATELAREAAQEIAGSGQVGDHLATTADADRVATHLFACLSTGYVGWNWAVTVSRATRSKVVTVSETVLLPGPGALLAPPWVPWTDRVRPGDLKVGDLMPASLDDPRLTPLLAIEGDDGLHDWSDNVAWAGTRGLAEDEAAGKEGGTAGHAGRPDRVMSAYGRDETAVRWYRGDSGPHAAMASAAPGHCQTCGFLVRLSGPLGRVFGACANEYAPDDGKVVSADHGCGAHSDAGIAAELPPATTQPAIDELGYEVMAEPGSEIPDSVLETIDHELQ